MNVLTIFNDNIVIFWRISLLCTTLPRTIQYIIFSYYAGILKNTGYPEIFLLHYIIVFIL